MTELLDIVPFGIEPNDINLGETRAVKPGKAITIIELKRDLSVPRLTTFLLAVKYPEGCVNGEYLPMVRGALDWGAGATRFYAEFDFLNGTQISVIATTFKLVAYAIEESPPWDPVCDCDPCFEVSAAVGLGAMGRNSNPARFTQIVQIKEPGDRKCVPIPAFATSLTVLPINDGIAGIAVVGSGTKYKVHYDVGVPLSNVNQYNVENALPLFNGARFVEVTNKNPDAPLAALLIFGLAL